MGRVHGAHQGRGAVRRRRHRRRGDSGTAAHRGQHHEGRAARARALRPRDVRPARLHAHAAPDARRHELGLSPQEQRTDSRRARPRCSGRGAETGHRLERRHGPRASGAARLASAFERHGAHRQRRRAGQGPLRPRRLPHADARRAPRALAQDQPVPDRVDRPRRRHPARERRAHRADRSRPRAARLAHAARDRRDPPRR